MNKTAMGGLLSPFKKLQQLSGTKELEITTQKGKKSFIFSASLILQVGIAQHHKGTPQQERVPLIKKKESVSDKLPQILAHNTLSASISPHPETSKTEAYGDG